MFHFKEVIFWIVLGAVFTPLAFLLMPVVIGLALIGGILVIVGSFFKNKRLFRHF